MSVENESMEEFLERIENIREKQVEEERHISFQKCVDRMRDDLAIIYNQQKSAYQRILDQLEK